jgi:multidrug efflux system outer membrane protein
MMNDPMVCAAHAVIATTATAWGLSGRKWWPALFLVTLLAACSASLPPIDQAALPATPAAYKEGDGRWTVAPPAEAQARGEWWKAFGDPALDDLVVRANAASPSIQVAAARLKQARAFVRAAEAQRLPEIDASASAARAGGVFNGIGGPARSLHTAGASLSYEVDLFGRLAQAADAAKLDAQSAEGLLQSARLLVQADVAQTYLALRAIDDERALVRSTVVAYQETLALTERRYRAGDAAELDVARARTEVAATESEALALDRRRAELEHALAVLVGEPASNFALATGAWDTALPIIPAGVPSTLLTRRPDVSAAQNSLLAAQTRVGVAKAAWFPSIGLTANAGYASGDLHDLFQWPSRAWSLGLIGSLPLFDGGRRRAGIENASGEFDAAIARYREQVLVAFQDVEDQLSGLRLLAEQSQAQDRAVTSAARSTALSEIRYRNGYVSQLELLDAQRSELRNRREALQVRSAQYQSTVALVRALGGGWDKGS